MSAILATQATHHRPEPTGHADGCCLAAPPFDHLAYRYGQMLTPAHLQRAQQSVYEKLKLHNRCLHGWGVVCGLEVTAVPPEPECPPEQELDPTQQAHAAGQHLQAAAYPPRYPCDIPKAEIRVGCGIAIDCAGHDLVVRDHVTVDLYSALSAEDRRTVDDGQSRTLWVSLCFSLTGIEWVRAAAPAACDTGTDAFHAFQREGVCVRVTLQPPPDKDPCEICCTCCDADCVVLARIDGYCRGHRAGEIHNSVRRLLARYTPTVVSGIGWYHGGTYAADDVDKLLWETGLRVTFSRPVYADTLTEGVCDVYVHGRHNRDLWVLDGTIELGPETDGMVTWFYYRGDPSEQTNVDPSDRILFILRADTVLDHCCLPVDGNHVGGLVPALPGAPKPVVWRHKVACRRTPLRTVPWASGDRTPGSTFESWFIAATEPDRRSGRKGAP
jgi:hypothetical protein